MADPITVAAVSALAAIGGGSLTWLWQNRRTDATAQSEFIDDLAARVKALEEEVANLRKINDGLRDEKAELKGQLAARDATLVIREERIAILEEEGEKKDRRILKKDRTIHFLQDATEDLAATLEEMVDIEDREERKRISKATYKRYLKRNPRERMATPVRSVVETLEELSDGTTNKGE